MPGQVLSAWQAMSTHPLLPGVLPRTQVLLQRPDTHSVPGHSRFVVHERWLRPAKAQAIAASDSTDGEIPPSGFTAPAAVAAVAVLTVTASPWPCSRCRRALSLVDSVALPTTSNALPPSDSACPPWLCVPSSIAWSVGSARSHESVSPAAQSATQAVKKWGQKRRVVIVSSALHNPRWAKDAQEIGLAPEGGPQGRNSMRLVPPLAFGASPGPPTEPCGMTKASNRLPGRGSPARAVNP